jgi:protein-L-isoaspartate O-methyltransferase
MQNFEQDRREMVELLRRRYQIHDERVLSVMERVPRHLFVPGALSSKGCKKGRKKFQTLEFSG